MCSLQVEIPALASLIHLGTPDQGAESLGPAVANETSEGAARSARGARVPPPTRRALLAHTGRGLAGARPGRGFGSAPGRREGWGRGLRRQGRRPRQRGAGKPEARSAGLSWGAAAAAARGMAAAALLLLLLLLLVPVPLLPLLAPGPGGALGNRHTVYWNSSNQQ